MEMALQNPSLYVLKPQREGGGKMLSALLNFVILKVMLLTSVL